MTENKISRSYFLRYGTSALLRFARYVHSQRFKGLFVYVGKNDGGVDLAVFQFVKLLDGELCRGIVHGADRQRHQYLIRVQTGIDRPHVLDLQALQGLYDLRGNELRFVVDAAQKF